MSHVPSARYVQQISPWLAFAAQSRLGKSYRMSVTSGGGVCCAASRRMPSSDSVGGRPGCILILALRSIQ